MEEIIFDSTKPFEQRVKAAYDVAAAIEEKQYIPTKAYEIFRYYLTMDIDELGSSVEFAEFPSEEEKIIATGVFKYRENKIRKELEKADISKLIDRFFNPKSATERRIAEEMILKYRSEIKKDVYETISAMMPALIPSSITQLSEAAKDFRSILEEFKKIASNFFGLSPNIPTEMLPMCSEAQIQRIKKPTKGYARMAFRAGMWNDNWGDPEEYGIDVESELRFVDKVGNEAFRRMLMRRGIFM